MIDGVETKQARKKTSFRTKLLLLAILFSPLACCGGTYTINVLPDSLVPPIADFMLNLFEADVRIENRSAETLFITPITTTTGKPVVIRQLSRIKQRDIPLQPNHSVVITYDMADMSLSGIAVCRASGDCRLLEVDHSELYSIGSIDNLPKLEQEWLIAIQASPERNFGILIYPALGLVPIVLFVGWLYLGIKERKRK